MLAGTAQFAVACAGGGGSGSDGGGDTDSDVDCGKVDECTTETCTTASGYTDGICLSDAVNAYCMRQCTPDNDVCDIVHSCAALIDGEGAYAGGACIPN